MSALVLLSAVLLAGTPSDQPPIDQAKAAAALKRLPANTPNRELIEEAASMASIQKPTGCMDKCKVLDMVTKKTCNRTRDGKKPPPTAVKKCEESMKQVSDACEASCKDKGQIDRDYIRSKIKVPQMPAGQGGADGD